MSKTFLISDTHFGHTNILTFKTNEGTLLRNFSSVEEMDEHIIQKWNSVVGVNDKVYHLGDVGFKPRILHTIMPKLKGTKILIKGNHDTLKPSIYLQYFKDIRAYHILDKFVLSHVPIHPESLSRWRGNIHGHTHSHSLKDSKYINVSVENINYTPINFELIRKGEIIGIP